LRRKWHAAVADDSDGLDPDEVFGRIEAKYEGAVDARVSE